jgi:molybdopterin synthase sulfur carrier subunit
MKKSWITLEIPEGSSVWDFMTKLGESKGPRLLKKLMKKDKIRSEIRILVNGRDITYLRGLKTKLKDHDLISVLPVVGGG